MTTTCSNGTRIDHYEIIRQPGHGGMNNADAPQMDATKRQIILGLIITGAILVVIVAIGILAQVLHNVVR